MYSMIQGFIEKKKTERQRCTWGKVNIILMDIHWMKIKLTLLKFLLEHFLILEPVLVAPNSC